MGAESEISHEGRDILWKSLVLECIQRIVTQRRVNLGTILCSLTGTNVLQGWKGQSCQLCSSFPNNLRLAILLVYKNCHMVFIFKLCSNEKTRRCEGCDLVFTVFNQDILLTAVFSCKNASCSFSDVFPKATTVLLAFVWLKALYRPKSWVDSRRTSCLHQADWQFRLTE